MTKNPKIVSHDEEMKKVNDWWTKQGLNDFEDSEFLVNGLRKIDDETYEVDAFVNVYLTDKSIISAQITFKALKRD